MKIPSFVKNFKWTSSNKNLAIILFICFCSFALTYPFLSKIPPHPDENQFNTNAFRILNGQVLANYLHVALTEYLLAAFFAIVNIFTMPGSNFPQGSPDLVTFYWGRVFGLILYFVTFLLGSLIVQKGEKEVKLRTVLFALLYFGSLGVFERFLRVNSDSMTVFVFVNFFLVSLALHKKKAPLYYFFLDNLFFLFLLSFSNIKSLYLAIPLLVLNTICPILWYEQEEKDSPVVLPRFYGLAAQAIFFLNVIFLAIGSFTKWSLIHLSLPVVVANSLNPYLWIPGQNRSKNGTGKNLYKIILYGLGLAVGAVFLWTIFMPLPFDARQFYYQVKSTIIYGTIYDTEYTTQADHSGRVYLYDLFVEYVGLLQLAVIVALVILAYKWLGRKVLTQEFKASLDGVLQLKILKSGDLYLWTEVVLILSFITYYLGVSLRVIHWSRWGIPMGMIALMLLSFLLERIIFLVRPHLARFRRGKLLVGILFFVAVSWATRLALTYDLATDNFPTDGGHYQTTVDMSKLIKELGISPVDAPKKMAWFPGGPGGVPGFSPGQLDEPQFKDTKYILWPAYQIGVVYADKVVDRSSANQRAFLDKYVESVDYRFPSILSRYTHYTKYFAWKYLGLAYTPEIENLFEPQYAVVKLKDFVPPMSYTWTFDVNKMSHYYLPYSPIFNIRNLPDGYMFPPCSSNPSVVYISSGKPVPEDPVTRSKTLGYHCHSMRMETAYKGTYLIKIEGLPPDIDNDQRVYSAFGYNYDPVNRVIAFVAPQQYFGVEFGVATKENYAPNLKFYVYYESTVASPQTK